ncbi:MAG: HPr family phosphocarrier protein [bacterium]
MSNAGQKREASERILVRELKIQNKLGLHARPAALFVKAANRFMADVTVEKGCNKVSGKSIMGLMTLEAGFGTVLRIIADGVDAEAALDEIQSLMDSKFFEG